MRSPAAELSVAFLALLCAGSMFLDWHAVDGWLVAHREPVLLVVLPIVLGLLALSRSRDRTRSGRS